MSESESSDEEEQFTGQWDERCREVSFDMQSKKSAADSFAKECVEELVKKNIKCEFS